MWNSQVYMHTIKQLLTQIMHYSCNITFNSLYCDDDIYISYNIDDIYIHKPMTTTRNAASTTFAHQLFCLIFVKSLEYIPT